MAKSEEEQDWREEARERFKEKQQKGRFKLVEGENTLRILPRVGSKKSKAPFFEYLVHREVGPNKRFVRCGKTLHGEGDCWLCDEKIPALRDSGEDSKEKRAAALAPKEQFVVQVAAIDQDSGKARGPFLWTVPTGGARSLAARLLGVLKSTKRDYVDAEEGYNITIERTGTGKNDTMYGQIVADEDSSKVPSKILAASKPFSTYIPPYSEEQQKAAYFGRDVREEEAEEEEPKKKKGRSAEDEEESETETETEEDEAPKKKKKAADEEEEEAEPEEEEEEETPKKKKKKAAEEEEEEEEEPAEDEEDEAPKKKKKKASEEDEEEEAEPEEEEEEERPKAKKKKAAEEEEEEEPEPEEDEESAPKKKAKKKVADEEEEEAEPEEEEEDEDEKPKKKKSKAAEEDETDTDDEEEKPKKKKKSRPSDDD